MVAGYGQLPYGTGPYGSIGGVILPNLIQQMGGGYGGIPYGLGPYGSVNYLPPKIPVSGGYGGYPYGTGPYGSVGSGSTPSVLGAVSIDGFTIEVLFSSEMSIDAVLLDPASYTLTPILGAAPSTVQTVELGLTGNLGATSVLLKHSGTTLGGLYKVSVIGPKDVGGTSIEAYHPLNEAQLLTKGEPPPFTAQAISGNEVLLTFEQTMLEEAGFSPGILQTDAYAFITDYPQTILPQAVDHPYTGDKTLVKLDVLGMTDLTYQVIISPALAISYDGTALPNDASQDFTGVTVGAGSSSIVVDGLAFQNEPGSSYGWRFLDESGKLLPNSSDRFTLNFNLTEVTWTPSLEGEVFSVFCSDADIRVELLFKSIGGDEYLEVRSGAFSYQALLTWTEELEIEVVRNQKADTYCVVVQGEVFVADLTASFTAPAGLPAGVQITLASSGAFVVENVILQSLRVTASQTVFSEAWNFLHLHEGELEGDAEFTKTSVETKKGPLVKGWGDATPATKLDVHLYVNGVEVEVVDVNPFMGWITPAVPIPLMPPGTMTVEVDYKWFPSPTFVLSQLNYPGAVLNQVGCKTNCPAPKSKGQFLGGTYSPPGYKFPMGVVLGPFPPPTQMPLLRSPRHVGFEHAYTSALNSPTTLLLNEHPHKPARPYNTIDNEGVVIFYEGSAPPLEEGWVLVGEEDPIPDPAPPYIDPDALEKGFFQLLKDTSGSYETGHTTIYTQEVESYTSSSIVIVTRLQIQRDVLEFHGVFTGVGFGAHTNNHLYMVGALEINGVMHLGVLQEPARMEERESWALAYEMDLQVIAPNQATVSTDLVPTLVFERLRSDDVVRIQILDGPQAGVYTIQSILALSDETSALVMVETFPADYLLWGNAYVTGYLEIAWDGEGFDERPTTYRLTIQEDTKTLPRGRASLFVGGSLTGKALDVPGIPDLAIPPDSILTLVTGTQGQIFWGSLDRQTQNLSDWYFFRYGATPAQNRIHSRGLVVFAEMNEVPEKDPKNIWYVTQNFGARKIDASADNLLLQATSSSLEEGADGLDLTFGYGRLEPFLDHTMNLDVDVKFQVDTGILGSRDASVLIQDGLRSIHLATLLYQEDGVERSLVQLSSRSLCGLLDPASQGWTITGDAEVAVNGRHLEITQASGQNVTFTASLDTPLSGGRVAMMRLAGKGVMTTDPDEDTFAGMEVIIGDPGPQSYGVGIRLRLSDEIVVYSTASLAAVDVLSYTWNDEGIHTYRILADEDVGTVSLVVDDQVLGTWSWADFDPVVASTEVRFVAQGTLTTGLWELWDLSVHEQPLPSAKRTLGVYLRGDPTTIDAWEIPRTDSLTVSNSDLSAVVEEMDWRDPIRIRIHRDPAWGVTVLRPDLPPPPYFDGKWSTNTIQPSAGWINVEYRNLPSDTSSWGSIRFGSLTPESITQSRWDQVRYRLYRYPSKDVVYKHPHVLNRYNVLTSGEIKRDITVEVYTVMSLNATQVKLTSINIYAKTVFNLQYQDAEGNMVVLYDDSYTFDPDTQVVTLVEGLTFRPLEEPPDPVTQLPGDDIDPNTIKIPVTVSFSPGKPYTKTYVCSQSLWEGVTLLNEGTPPMVLSQIGETTQEVQWGSQINDPLDLLGEEDFILNDPYKFLAAVWTEGAVYEDVERCEVSEGEKCLLSPFCDESVLGASEAGSPGQDPWDIGNGLIEVGLEGLLFTEVEPITFSDGPSGPFGEALSTIFLKASGDGSPPGGTLGGAILFTPLGPETTTEIPAKGWSVFGVLYDTLTDQTEILYFDTQSQP